VTATRPHRGLLFGTFDLLHPGHLSVFAQAQALVDELAIIIARDTTVQRLKGLQPHESEEQRRAAVQAALPNATVVLGDEAGNFLAPVQLLAPDLILLGYDQRLPPGLTEQDLPVPVVRLNAFEPHLHKSSLRRLAAEGGQTP
jgi:FAD synthetase